MFWKPVLTTLVVLMSMRPAGADPLLETLRSDLIQGGIPVESVATTPARGVYEVVSRGKVYFIFASAKDTTDGKAKYYLSKELVDLSTGQDLGENTRDKIRRQTLAEVDEDRMLTYGPDDAKHTVTVFTDTTCGYCRLLHQHMADYNDQGIRVRYMFYPRAGKDSQAYKTLASIWCSQDRRTAMDRAKTPLPVEENICGDHPVDRHMQMGQRFALGGTPAIITETGKMIAGYMPPKELRQTLDQLTGR